MRMSRIVDQILRIRETGGLLEGAKLTTGTLPPLAATISTGTLLALPAWAEARKQW